MKAAIFQGVGKIEAGEQPDPVIKEQPDAIVRVVLACVCGSDLWYYRGITPHPKGSIGHEFIGVVEEVGSDVKTIQKGDFVIAPFAFSDGTCPNCKAGFQTACTHGGFFGLGNEGGGPAPVRAYMAELLDTVLAGKINPGRVFDFTTDLDHIADAYAAMDERRAIKSLIKVGTI